MIPIRYTSTIQYVISRAWLDRVKIIVIQIHVILPLARKKVKSNQSLMVADRKKKKKKKQKKKVKKKNTARMVFPQPKLAM